MTEPMTVATDYVLSAQAIALGWLLWRGTRESLEPRRLWAWAFWALGLGALLGGTYHGLATALGSDLADLLWSCTMISVGASGLLLLGATVRVESGAAAWRRWRAVLIAAFLAYAAWVGWFDSRFQWAVVTYGSAMAAAMVLHLRFAAQGRAGSGWIVGGIGVSFLGAGIQVSGYAPHPGFNHNDLYHVIQMLGVGLLYVGAAAGGSRDDWTEPPGLEVSTRDA